MQSRNKEAYTDAVKERLESENFSEEKPFGKESHLKMWIDKEKFLKQERKYGYARRAQDIVLSVVALLALAIPMLIVACVIWIDSPGDGPMFMQERVGQNGKVFKLLKFRTMIPNAEEKLNALLAQNEMNGPVFKIKDDPRITRVGRFLRRVSIDELPQFINVLLGNMSIVGPRPALPREVEQYDEYEKQRLLVMPGLTCYWQVQPRRNDLSFEEWVELDLKYIRERSLLTDWRIIFKTFSAVLHGEGE